VGDLVKSAECYESVDEEFDSLILDEDKLLDAMEPILAEGGCVVDFHSCELFPERWFDLVLVLRADTNTLFDRLVERNYSEKKRDENVECEIMQTVLEEAMESYRHEIVHELQSNTIEQLEENVERVVAWYDAWKGENS
jgi:adenylate kinase